MVKTAVGAGADADLLVKLAEDFEGLASSPDAPG